MYTQEEYYARALIEEAAEIEARRAAFRASRRAEFGTADASVEAQGGEGGAVQLRARRPPNRGLRTTSRCAATCTVSGHPAPRAES